MSASEKLQQLAYEVEGNDQANLRVGHTLLAALPEIIGVVTATENGYSVEEDWESFNHCGACHGLLYRGHEPDCPLVALAVKLGVDP